MPGGPSSQPSSESERKKLIAEYTEAKRSEAERLTTADQLARVRKRRTQVVVLCVLLATTLYVSLNPPAWMLPSPVPVPTATEREASIRFALYLQAQQVEHFRETNGRLPGTLNEPGEPLPGIDYTILSGGAYKLTSTRDSSIRLTSTDSLNAFLGESLSHLGGGQ